MSEKKDGSMRAGRWGLLGAITLMLMLGTAVCVAGAWFNHAQADTTAAELGAVAMASATAAPLTEAGPHAGRQLNGMILLLFVFLIAIFLGVELLSKVPSQLHTPLMSGANAISGITVVGACIAAGQGSTSSLMMVLGVVAMVCAMINVAGGYVVTDRMLRMFKAK